MNDLTLLREHGPDAPAASAAVLDRARGRLLADIGSEPSRRGRWSARDAGRPVRIRLAVAAATVVAVAAGGGLAARTHGGAASNDTSVAGPAVGLRLVAFTPPEFPVDLSPRPAGRKAPTIFGDHDAHGLALTAVYLTADGSDSDVYLAVRDGYAPDPHVSPRPRSVTFNGAPAYLDEFHLDGAGATTLTWQRDGKWISLTGNGALASEEAVRRLAATVVDQPQPVALEIHLAPAGWRLEHFKDSGRIMTLHDPATGEELAVDLVDAPDPDLFHDVAGARQAGTVQVNGADSQLIRTDDGWFLEVPVPDGRALHLQAPAALTSDQVVSIAAGVTVGTR